MVTEIIKGLIKSKLTGQKSINELKKAGLTVGKNFKMLDGCLLDISHCWLIKIGDNVTLAPRVHILAHDASTKMFLGYAKIGRVLIGSNVFIGAGTIILPNVTIGDNVVIGAGSVVTKDVPSNSVAFGNPAKVHCSIYAYLERNRLAMKKNPVYDSAYTVREGVSKEMKQKMVVELTDKTGYVE